MQWVTRGVVAWSRTPAGLTTAILLVAGTFYAGPAEAQEEPETRVLTVVDYVSDNDVYLAAGSDHGLRVGDTLPAYDGEGEGADFLGVFTILSANERRSVATFTETPFTVARADLLYLGLPRALVEARTSSLREVPGVEADVSTDAEQTPATPADSTPQPEPRPPLQIKGRISLDMDALQTTTRWGESPGEEASRMFSTPTFRLQARAQDLPGGMRLGTSMRLSHRTSTDDLVRPTTSLRFYQFDLEKNFERVPVQLHLGRFHNPFDDYSGYWDGLMVHLGEAGLGAGVAVGFEPELWNEGPSTERPKVSGFVDYDARGQEAEYSGVFSFHTLRPKNDSPDRTYLGLSQRVRLGSAWIRQRLQVDQSLDGADWTVTRLQLDASLSLSGGLSAHGGWRRWRPYYPVLPTDRVGPRRDRASFGLSYWASGGGLSADVSLDRPEVGEESRTVSSSFFLRRTPLFGLGFSGMASYWTRGERSSVLLSPEVRRAFGIVEVRGAYRFYETSSGFGEIRHQSADMAISLRLGTGLSVRVQGFVQWGGDLTSNRILASLWKSF